MNQLMSVDYTCSSSVHPLVKLSGIQSNELDIGEPFSAIYPNIQRLFGENKLNFFLKKSPHFRVLKLHAHSVKRKKKRMGGGVIKV